MKKVQYVLPPRCCKCGKHLWQEEEEYCKDCGERTHYFDAGRALYEYTSVNRALYRLKYSGRAEYAETFGEELAFYMKDFLQEIKPDALIPVPMHPKKERSRGYNQSVLLARAVGAYTNIPVYENYIKRIRNTAPLKLLNPEERLNNLKKAFILTENGVKLKVVVIIDDIFTTGSTINEMSKVLRLAGVQKIYFLTLAIGETI
jgi:ComF family protein